MSQIYPLDAIVRRVDKDHRANGVGEKIVVINPDKRTVVSGGGLMGRLREYRYFLVSNTRSQRSAESATPVISIRDFANNRRVPVFVSYVASCEQGSEEKVALSLFDGPHPAAVLNEAIGRWVNEKVGQKSADFIDHYFAMKTEVEEYIVERALAETGLSLKAILKLDMKGVVESFAVGPVNMPVLTQGYDREQNLKLRVELHVDWQYQIRAVQHQPYLNTLDRLVREETQKYFAAQVSFHRFATELHGDAIKAGLTAHLDAAVRFAGRKVGALSIQADRLDLPPAFYETQKNIEYKLQEYPHPVRIENTLQMKVFDYALYVRSGEKSLNDWLDKELGEAVRVALFGKKYTALLLKFGPIETEVKDRLVAAAKRIGYGIKQLMVVAYVKERILLKKFSVEVEGDFRTKLSNFSVNLSVVVTARIGELPDVEKYINSGEDVQEAMRQTILKKTKEIIRAVEPERFYMRFSYTDRVGEKPVEQWLIDDIKKELVSEYKAKDISVSPTMGESDITKVWEQLRKKSSDFRVETASPNPDDLEPIVIDGKFSIEAIDHKGWDKFSQKATNVQDIRQYLEGSLVAKLSIIPSGLLAYRDVVGQRELETLVEALAKASVLEEFGLLIKVKNVKRHPTALELRLQQYNLRLREAGLEEAERAVDDEKAVAIETNTQIRRKIIELEGYRLELISGSAPEEEVERVQQDINTLKAELQRSQIPTVGKIRRQLYAAAEPEHGRLSDYVRTKRHKGELSNGDEGSKEGK
jgi:hypothetical protein